MDFQKEVLGISARFLHRPQIVAVFEFHFMKYKLHSWQSSVPMRADARYIAGRIVKNLWIIFVALPFVLGVLIVLLK